MWAAFPIFADKITPPALVPGWIDPGGGVERKKGKENKGKIKQSSSGIMSQKTKPIIQIRTIL